MSLAWRILITTIVLGGTVEFGWLAWGAIDDIPSLLPRIQVEAALPLLVLLAVAAGLAMAVLVRMSWPDLTVQELVITVVLAWLAEAALVVLVGPVLADEIDPANAWWFWLLATGFGMQPVGALLGGLVARAIATGAVPAD
ncbi:MAG: hypothetical protein H0V04_03445 [Chloroflexi bacterium]|nr:hypothetical protein [Chloroflexota bacterium]